MTDSDDTEFLLGNRVNADRVRAAIRRLDGGEATYRVLAVKRVDPDA